MFIASFCGFWNMSVYSLMLSYVIMTVISHCKITAFLDHSRRNKHQNYEIITKILLASKVKFPAASSTLTLLFYGSDRTGNLCVIREERVEERKFPWAVVSAWGYKAPQPPRLSVLFLQMLETHGQFQSAIGISVRCNSTDFSVNLWVIQEKRKPQQ